MGSKMIVFLGMLASMLLIYVCIVFCSGSFYSVWNQYNALQKQEAVQTATSDSKILTVVQDNTMQSKKEKVIVVPQKNIEINSSKIPTAVVSTVESKSQDKKPKEVMPSKTVAKLLTVIYEGNTYEIKENNVSGVPKAADGAKKPQTLVANVSPDFSYIIEKGSLMVDALLPKSDENGTLNSKIDALCKIKTMCILNVNYKQEVKKPSWNNFVLELISFFASEKSQVAKVTIKENKIKLEGTLSNKAIVKKLDELIEKYKKEGLNISNLTNIKSTEVLESVHKKGDKGND